MPPKKNAYFYYMLEYQRMEKAKGRNLSIAQASTMASDSWKNLSESEKTKYKQMAKNDTGPKTSAKPPICGNNGYTSQGIPLAQVLREEKQRKMELQKMKDTVTDILVKGKLGTGIEKIVFHVIHMNMFYQNYPCEVAICKFTIEDGIFDSFHTFVKIDKLPLGSAYEAKTHSEKIHGLPLPPSALGNDDYYGIFQCIREFVTFDKQVILFCHPNSINTIKNGLDFLDGGVGHNNFLIADFVECFHQMHNLVFCGSPRADLGYSGVKLIMDRDIFDSVVKGCSKHDELDRNLTCSESIVKRLAYQFIQTFITTFDIQPIPGLHVPKSLLLQKPEIDQGTDLESLMGDLNVDETSDETTSFYDTESTTDNEFMEPVAHTPVPLQMIFNETNPFVELLLEETLNSTQANQPPRNLSVRNRRILETFGIESDFEVESHYEGDDTESLNETFQYSKFAQLLDCVRKNSHTSE